MSELQEGVLLEPAWSFAKSKELSGSPDSWGQDIRTALKTHVLYGALEVKDAPFSVEQESNSFLRQIKNWPKLENKAIPHKKQSYFKVTGQYDNFDNARASIYKFKSPIGFGVNFGWPAKQVVLNKIPNSGNGHAVTAVGFSVLETGEESIIVQNSYGPTAGDCGVHYMTRKVFNHFADLYGMYMFVDISKEDAQILLKNGVQLDDNWFVSLWKRIKTKLSFIINKYV